MPRYFTLATAEAVLPSVEKALQDALLLKAEYESAERELQAINQQIYLMGGMRLDSGRILGIRAEKDQAATKLKERFEEIEQIGCVVKDLEAGLIDFPTLYRGNEVYLCWRFGEDRIQFWHGVEEGFRGRKVIDDEFRANHRASERA